MRTSLVVTPAVNIHYPYNKDRRLSAYVVDQDKIDPLLMQQKEYLLSLYRTMTLSQTDLDVRHQAREYAMSLLDLFKPLWIMFEYEYKYHELFCMFNEYTIV